MSTSLAERRTSWALPPQPPENWVGRPWGIALVVALGTCVLPLLRLLDDRSAQALQLTALHGIAGCAAVATAYTLVVQASVTSDVRLRWVAAGYAAVWPLALLRSAELDGGGPLAQPDRAAPLGLLALLVVPLFALTCDDARRRLSAVLLPLLAVAATALAVVLLPALPELVHADGTRSGALRTAGLAVALVGVVAAVAGRRDASRSGSTWAWIAAGLALTALAGVVVACAGRRYETSWWAGQLLLAAALVVPAAGLSLVSAAGYRRQSRRWRQLVAEVADLRAASPLLPGLSVSPEDDEGLPPERDVRMLINANTVKVALQPVVQLDNNSVVGFEALSRFGGRVPTDRWFRAASRYGLGGELERLTLRNALALLPDLQAEVFLAVNVSPAALEDDEVLGMLHASDLRRVVVEVTEHEAVGDYTGLRVVLQALRDAGARIAVDDTGAGFASLRHVLMLQPDVVKLDTSLSRAVHYDERQRRLVTALLTFAGEVGSLVLAEGVETEEQLVALRELGVPLGQGWHLGMPTIVR